MEFIISIVSHAFFFAMLVLVLFLFKVPGQRLRSAGIVVGSSLAATLLCDTLFRFFYTIIPIDFFVVVNMTRVVVEFGALVGAWYYVFVYQQKISAKTALTMFFAYIASQVICAAVLFIAIFFLVRPLLPNIPL